MTECFRLTFSRLPSFLFAFLRRANFLFCAAKRIADLRITFRARRLVVFAAGGRAIFSAYASIGRGVSTFTASRSAVQPQSGQRKTDREAPGQGRNAKDFLSAYFLAVGVLPPALDFNLNN